VDVSRHSGDGLAIVECSKGAGFDDLDNDGDMDVAILNVNAAPSVLRNDTPTRQRSLQILLRGVAANRDGVGARVKVIAGDSAQIAEVHSGRGYQSHYGSRLHFGLADAAKADRIEVRWPGGEVEIIDDPVDAPMLLITQGKGCLPLKSGAAE
jgi:hypothetical protein